MVAPRDPAEVRDLIFQKRDALAGMSAPVPVSNFGRVVTKQPEAAPAMENAAVHELREIKSSLSRSENMMASKN